MSAIKRLSGLFFLIFCVTLIWAASKAEAAAPNVIPSLREWTASAGNLKITSSSRIVIDLTYSTQLTDVATTFKADLLALNGLNLSVVTAASPSAGDFFLTLNNTDTGIGQEGYIMQVATNATIKASTAKGVFYGTRTALQILKQSQQMAFIMKGTARDYPAYQERGFMIDVARKYFTVDYLKDYIKKMAFNKMNDFHIHFTDDGAFRLQSTTYPGLAAAQSYSHADLAALQAVAKQYHVTITPEIDLPAHATSITAYMPAIQNQSWPGVLNLSLPATFTFVNNILNEFVPLFDAPDFNIGTDETPTRPNGRPEYGNVDVDSDSQTYNYALSLGYTTAGELYRKFINDYNTTLRGMGKNTRVWAFFDSLPGGIAINNNVIYDAWLADGINSVSSRGFNIINSSSGKLYSVPGTGWQPDNVSLYQSWYPYQFDAFGISNVLSSTDPHILGAKFNNWNDISVAKGFTEQEIDKILAPTIKVLSEITWGGTRSTGGYAEFANRMALTGDAPGLTLLGGNSAINLALTRPVVVSSTTPTLDGYAAVDGGGMTRWASAEGLDPQWIYVDLGTSTDINRVKLYWEAYAKAYSIDVSNDATNWTTVYSTISGEGGIEEVSFPTIQARYVRMNGTQRGTAWGYSLFEFGIYYDLPVANNLALNQPVMASSEYPAANVASHAVDGNEITRWSSAEGVDPQWIYIDLGAAQNFNHVRLNWETAYGKSYKIQVSNDALTWTDVYTTTLGVGGIEDINFPVANARYVRMYGTQRGTSHGYSLYDFGVSLDTQAPTAPAALISPSNTDNSVYLSWTPSTDNVAVLGYDVYQGATKVNTQLITSSHYNVTGLMPFTSYSFTVVAKDAAGNVSPVSNNLSLKTNYTPTLIAVDDPNAGITYSSGWTSSGSLAGYYQSTGHYSNTAGSYAQYTFTGTSFYVISVKNTNQGKADVYMDGVFDSTIDLYTSGYLQQVEVYSKTGLSYGSHTVKVVLRSDKNSASTGYYVSIDAFKYDSGVTSRVDDGASGTTYTGSWSSGTIAGYYNNTVHWSRTAADSMQYTFTGRVINVIGTTNSDHGKADVYIDGTLESTIDTYSVSQLSQSVIYSKTGLSNSTHTIKIVVRSDKNAASTGYYTDIDAFEFSSALTNVTDDADLNANLTYSGNWLHGNAAGHYNNTTHWTSTAADYVQYTFSGRSIHVLGLKSNNHGKADVYIDGSFDTTIDTYSSGSLFQAVIYSKNGLSNTIHTVKIVLRSDKNASSTGYYIDIDAFQPVKTQLDDSSQGIGYAGNWSSGTSVGYFNNTVHWSNTAADSIIYTFTGTTVSVIGATNSTHGKADVYIDGALDSTIDTYSAATVPQSVIYSKSSLASGLHTIKIVIRSDKNASSSGYYTDIDALEFTN